MYDLLKVKSYCEDISTLVTNFNLKPKTSAKNEKYYSGEDANLRIWANDHGNYLIKGSIWKYAEKHNYGAFSKVQLVEAINVLNSLTNGTFSLGKIIGYEYGFNIPTIHNPREYLSQMNSSLIGTHNYVLLEQNNRKRNKFWGIDTFGSHRGFKVYSKTAESNLDINLLRIEYYVRHVSEIYKRDINVLEIIEPSFIAEIQELLFKFGNNLLFKTDFNPAYLDQLSTSDKKLYLLACKNECNIRDVMDRLHLSGQTRYRTEKRLRKFISDSNGKNPIRSEFVNAFNNTLETYGYLKPM